MRHRLESLFFVAFSFLLMSTCIALAVDGGAAPETVAQASTETTKITWAWGATVQTWASTIGSLAFALVMFALRKLPGQVYSIIVMFRVDQMLSNAINYGINAVKDASKDKVLSVDVGNQVLAQAVQYVIDHAPTWLQDWMGGPEQIAQKIFARLNLPAEASAPSSQAVNLMLSAIKKA